MRRSGRFLLGLVIVLGFGILVKGSVLKLLPIVRHEVARADRTETAPNQVTLRAGPSTRALAAQAVNGPTIQTDRSDYYPGQNVVITGSGWQPGEVVTLVLHEDPTIDPDVTLYTNADASGNIFDNDFSTDWHDVGVTFTLSATGSNSGLSA